NPILCFDGDNAGRRAAIRAIERVLPILAADQSLKFAFLPEGEDPDSLIRSGGAAAFGAVLDSAFPLSEILWQMTLEGRQLNTPEAQAGLKKIIEAHISR